MWGENDGQHADGYVFFHVRPEHYQHPHAAGYSLPTSGGEDGWELPFVMFMQRWVFDTTRCEEGGTGLW